MAASTALPPRFRVSRPTCVAAGTLVQTIPCRARTSDRVAKCFPVIRSIWADARSTTTRRTAAIRIAFMLERLVRLAHSDSRNCKHSASNQILHASSNSDSVHVYLHRRFGERCGGAIVWTNTEENLFHADANPASQKENRYCGKKEIADANTNSVAEEKIFAHSEARGAGYANADNIAEKETNTDSGGRNADADSEEEKDFADAFTHRFASPEKEGIANSGAV